MATDLNIECGYRYSITVTDPLSIRCRMSRDWTHNHTAPYIGPRRTNTIGSSWPTSVIRNFPKAGQGVDAMKSES